MSEGTVRRLCGGEHRLRPHARRVEHFERAAGLQGQWELHRGRGQSRGRTGQGSERRRAV